MRQGDANPLILTRGIEDTPWPASSQASGTPIAIQLTVAILSLIFSQISLTQTDAILFDSSVYHQ